MTEEPMRVRLSRALSQDRARADNSFTPDDVRGLLQWAGANMADDRVSYLDRAIAKVFSDEIHRDLRRPYNVMMPERRPAHWPPIIWSHELHPAVFDAALATVPASIRRAAGGKA